MATRIVHPHRTSDRRTAIFLYPVMIFPLVFFFGTEVNSNLFCYRWKMIFNKIENIPQMYSPRQYVLRRLMKKNQKNGEETFTTTKILCSQFLFRKYSSSLFPAKKSFVIRLLLFYFPFISYL